MYEVGRTCSRGGGEKKFLKRRIIATTRTVLTAAVS